MICLHHCRDHWKRWREESRKELSLWKATAILLARSRLSWNLIFSNIRTSMFNPWPLRVLILPNSLKFHYDLYSVIGLRLFNFRSMWQWWLVLFVNSALTNLPQHLLGKRHSMRDGKDWVGLWARIWWIFFLGLIEMCRHTLNVGCTIS